MDRYKASAAVEAVKAYGVVARAAGLSPAQLSLAWCFTRPHVASTIIGATDLGQLRENLGTWGLVHGPEAPLRGRLGVGGDLADAVAQVYRRYRDPVFRS